MRDCSHRSTSAASRYQIPSLLVLYKRIRCGGHGGSFRQHFAGKTKRGGQQEVKAMKTHGHLKTICLAEDTKTVEIPPRCSRHRLSVAAHCPKTISGTKACGRHTWPLPKDTVKMLPEEIGGPKKLQGQYSPVLAVN